MPASDRLPARLLSSTLVALLALAAFTLGGLPAWAHAGLVGSTPADGATLKAAPGSVELVFSEEIDPQYSQVAVLGGSEAHFEQGDPVVVGERVQQPVADLPAGDYTISFRVVSADGHPVSGVVKFTVATPAAEPTAAVSEPEPVATGVAAPATTAEPDGSLTPLLIGLLAALAFVGLVVYLVMGRNRNATGSAKGQQ